VAAACWLVLAPAAVAAPAQPLQKARLTQHLGAQVPLSLVFKDETGRSVRLGEYFGARPVVLNFTYFGCSQLCHEVLDGLSASLGKLGPKDYEALTVSIDPEDAPAAAKLRKRLTPGASKAGVRWHFLTGDRAAIRQLTEACGFGYAYDKTTRQFAHPAGAMVLTPHGRLSRYFYGFEYPAPALGAALEAAKSDRIGHPVAETLLRCFHDVFASGFWGPIVFGALRVFCSLTVLAVGYFVGRSLWRERRARREG
jgi:protein SCO1/2